MNLAHWLQRSGVLYPDAPALLSGEAQVATYRQFAERVSQLAGGFDRQLGIKPGDRVALFMPNRTEYLEILYAAWHAGAAVVPINHKLHPREAAWIIENAGAQVVVVANDKLDEVQSQLVALSNSANVIPVDGTQFSKLRSNQPIAIVEQLGDDLAWLFYTSGTTGWPKGVMISHANIHAMTFAYFVDVDDVYHDDTALYAAPMSHGAGLYNFMHVLRGAKHVVPESTGFNPTEILQLARNLHNVSMFAAPTMVRRLIEQAKAENSDGEGLRTIVYGGGPMYVADIIDGVETIGPRFVQIYGQGECPMAITALSRDLIADRTHPAWRERLGSVGVAQSCVEVRIVDDSGKTLPAGQKGEIVVRGAPVMLGYWKNEEASNSALRNGWLWTGDVGVMDDEGFLTLADRSKDVIISGGSNIYPREVEEVLLLHPAVSEVSVIGSPNPEWGEDVVAFVVAHSDIDLSEQLLSAHCTDNMARFKRPKRYFFVSHLPKNNYGKVLKTELRQRLESMANNKEG